MFIVTRCSKLTSDRHAPLRSWIIPVKEDKRSMQVAKG